MKCQLCGKNDASICIVKMSEKKKESKYICSECIKGMEHNLFDNISDLISPMFSSLIEENLKDFESLNKFNMEELSICPKCGYTEGQRKESQKMGCSDCYKHFTLPIKDRHVGKMPKENKQSFYILNLINKKEYQLQKLIVEEKFEQAAILRDEIKNLKKEIESEA